MCVRTYACLVQGSYGDWWQPRQIAFVRPIVLREDLELVLKVVEIAHCHRVVLTRPRIRLALRGGCACVRVYVCCCWFLIISSFFFSGLFEVLDRDQALSRQFRGPGG